MNILKEVRIETNSNMNMRSNDKSVNKSSREFELEEIQPSLSPDAIMEKLSRKDTGVSNSKCFVLANKKLQCLTLYIVCCMFFIQLIYIIVEKTDKDNFNALSSRIIKSVHKTFKAINKKLENLPIKNGNETTNDFNSSTLFLNTTMDILNVYNNNSENELELTTITNTEY